MDALFNFMHKCCIWIVYIITLVLIDFPLKAILCILFFILAVLCCIFYPIKKMFDFPNWIGDLYDYATGHIWLSEKISDLWRD
jgi:hypothetical protein